MYFVLSGQLQLGDAYGAVTATVGAGQFFGEQACLAGSFITTSCRASSDCELLALERSDLLHMCKFHPDFQKVGTVSWHCAAVCAPAHRALGARS